MENTEMTSKHSGVVDDRVEESFVEVFGNQEKLQKGEDDMEIVELDEPPSFGLAVSTKKTDCTTSGIDRGLQKVNHVPIIPQSAPCKENIQTISFSAPVNTQPVRPMHPHAIKPKEARYTKRRDSIIQPAQTSSIKKSFAYACQTLLWLGLQSIFLGIAPTFLAIVLYGSTWLFDVNHQNILIFYLATNSFLILVFYAVIVLIFNYNFGPKKTIPLVYKVVLPMYTIHIAIFIFGSVYRVDRVASLCHLSFLVMFYLLVRNVQVSQPEQPAVGKDEEMRYTRLSCDGTPMALFKGLVPFMGVYFVSVYYLIPYFMGSSIIIRIAGRVLILPFLFNIVDTYQNSLLIYKSKKDLRYRTLLGNILNFIFLAILRLMITDAQDVRDTTILAISSGIFEIIFRSTFVLRAVYTMKLIITLSRKDFRLCISRRRIVDLNGALSINPSASVVITDSFRSLDYPDIENLVLSWDGVRRFLGELNRKDTIAEYIIVYRTNRAYFLCMLEFQFILFTTLIMYLCQPIRDYMTLQTMPTLESVGLSILVQIAIEVVTQVASISLENYLYGMEMNVQKSMKPIRSFGIISFTTLIGLTIICLSTFPFWRPPQTWTSV